MSKKSVKLLAWLALAEVIIVFVWIFPPWFLGLLRKYRLPIPDINIKHRRTLTG